MVSLARRAVARARRNNALRRFARNRKARFGRFRRKVYRGAMMSNPMPSFTETFKSSSVFNVNVGAGANGGYKFAVRITDIPQVGQYANLYKQYRINWIKVMLLPRIDTSTADGNAAIYNSLVGGTQWMGNGRICWAIQDSPDVSVPVSEQEVLEMNGAKIKQFRGKWSCSFKPVPNVYQGTVDSTGQPTEVYTRQKLRQWFNFETQLTGKNPEHGYVAAYLTVPGNVPAGQEPFVQTYYIYYKVNFTLRDPQ